MSALCFTLWTTKHKRNQFLLCWKNVFFRKTGQYTIKNSCKKINITYYYIVKNGFTDTFFRFVFGCWTWIAKQKGEWYLWMGNTLLIRHRSIHFFIKKSLLFFCLTIILLISHCFLLKMVFNYLIRLIVKIYLIK